MRGQIQRNQSWDDPAWGDLPWDDRRVDTLIGGLLRVGVSLAALVVLLGAVVYLIRNGQAPASYREFDGEPAEFRTLGGVLHAALAFRGLGIIQLGLLLLIATPVARVGLSIFGFAKQRDRLYVAVASVVFVILICSLVGS